jgi:hypothetical protein
MMVQRDLESPADVRERCGMDAPQPPRENHCTFEWNGWRLHAGRKATCTQNAPVEAGIMRHHKIGTCKHRFDGRPQLTESWLSPYVFPCNAVDIRENEIAPRWLDQMSCLLHNPPIMHEGESQCTGAVASVVRSFEIDRKKGHAKFHKIGSQTQVHPRADRKSQGATRDEKNYGYAFLLMPFQISIDGTSPFLPSRSSSPR